MSDEVPSVFRKIVVGVDGTDDSERALAWSARLAVTTNAEVLAVHVLTYDREFIRDMSPETMTTWRQQLHRDLESTWVTALATAGVRHRCLLVEAESAAGGLLEAADAQGADLVVVGSTHHGALAERLLGSTPSQLIRHGHHPVTVVPPAE